MHLIAVQVPYLRGEGGGAAPPGGVDCRDRWGFTVLMQAVLWDADEMVLPSRPPSAPVFPDFFPTEKFVLCLQGSSGGARADQFGGRARGVVFPEFR